MTQANRDLEQAGWQLQTLVAVALTNALSHVQRELSVLDGHPERGEQVPVRASAELTTVERTADARWALTDAREELRDAKANVLLAIRELNELCNRVLRMRQPKVVTKPDDTKGLCCSNQAGKHGVVEWGDPLCLRNGVKAGLCGAHYQAWYRARLRDGIDTTKDYEPV